MIMNLSKPFHFQRDKNEYSGRYLFRKISNEEGRTGVCLVLNVTVNDKEEKVYEIDKPGATLFQANDVIEEMIAEEVVRFSGTYKKKD